MKKFRPVVNALIFLLVVGIVLMLIPQIELLFARQKTHQVKVGMTRADLGGLFEHDGGIYFPHHDERYVLKNYACHDYQTFLFSIVTLFRGKIYWIDKSIKVQVTFNPKLTDTALGSPEDPGDQITRISEPFCEFPVRD